MDGRDIGTVICPNADIKLFISAAAKVRANRRYEELVARGVKTDLKKVIDDIIRRDEMDSKRDHSPLRKAKDAIFVDTSSLSISQAVLKVEKLVEHALKK